MNKVRIGIIGIGNMGSSHAGYLSAGEVPNAELTAVCDLNPDRILARLPPSEPGHTLQCHDYASSFSAVVSAVVCFFR